LRSKVNRYVMHPCCYKKRHPVEQKASRRAAGGMRDESANSADL